jgi:serine/threonine protein kinase
MRRVQKVLEDAVVVPLVLNIDNVFHFKKQGEPLGSGGAGQVFKVKHRRTKKVYALKILEPGLDRKTVHFEVNVLRYLSDAPNCKPYVSCFHSAFALPQGKYGNLLSFAVLSDFVKGDSLDIVMGKTEEMAAKEPLKYQCEMAAILWLLMRALAFLHDQNVAHRDIKLENAIFTKDRSNVVIIDLGLSCAWEEMLSCDIRPWVGTVQYAAPEVMRELRKSVRKRKPLTLREWQRADIYAAGVAAMLLLARIDLKTVQSLRVEQDRAGKGPLPFPKGAAVSVHPCLQRVVNLMTNVLPSKRPSAHVLMDEFENCRQEMLCMSLPELEEPEGTAVFF